MLGGTLEDLQSAGAQAARAALPVVAAVNGVAAGAGCNIALACDLVLAAKSATFVQAFARIGLVPDSGGTWISAAARRRGARARPRHCWPSPCPAEKAESWGLIWRAVADDGIDGRKRRSSACISRPAPTYGLGLIKRALDASEPNDLSTQLDLERDFQRDAGSSPDYAEGVRAFMEKRAPKFTGKQGLTMDAASLPAPAPTRCGKTMPRRSRSA